MKALRGTLVGLDTAPLIYLIEEHATYIPLVRPFFEALDRDEFRVVTSTLTLTEVLIHPMRHGDHELANRYRDTLLHATSLTTMPVPEEIAEQAAELRARHNLRTPDAIQLATALAAGASSFLTNDSQLPRLARLNTLVLSQLIQPQP